jgi:hypothetical protein
LRHHTAAKTASLISILHRSNFSTKITMFDQLVTPRKILPQHHGKASLRRCIAKALRAANRCYVKCTGGI